VPVLVTVTSYLRLHRDEVIFVRLHGNTVLLRFVSMKPVRLPVDDLTAEAREWLLPSMAPRDIPLPDEMVEDEATPRRREEAR
jgi:hypothetical protein